MFYCEICGRAFTRKFNLSRHSRTKHTTPNSDYATNHLDAIEHSNVVNNDDQNLSDISNNITDGYEDSSSRNGESNDNNESVALEVNNFIQGFPYKKDCFDQRILTATEAIRSKFNALRKGKIDFGNFENNNHLEDIRTNLPPKIDDATLFSCKLPELLQCALDILMIKELQNIDIANENKESLDDEDEDGRIKFTRPYSTSYKQINEDKADSLEETPFKRQKYDESMEHKNDGSYDIGGKKSEFFLRKYWHNANTLVDELRKLMSTTEIGQQISTLMKRLKEFDDRPYSLYYPVHKKERNKLIRNLNEMKETDIGKEIFCIIHELEKADIIEHVEYVADRTEYDSNEEDNNTVQSEEGLTEGEGLYIQPYKNLNLSKTNKELFG